MFGKDSSDKDYKNTNHRISQLRIHSYICPTSIYNLHKSLFYSKKYKDNTSEDGERCNSVGENPQQLIVFINIQLQRH